MNEKLKEALDGVDYKKPKSAGVAVSILIILSITFFFFITPPFLDSEPVVRNVATPIPPKISASNFTIPAMGVISIPRVYQCLVTSTIDKSVVVEKLTEDEVIYTSKFNKDIPARIWFHVIGNSPTCKDRYFSLKKQGLIK